MGHLIQSFEDLVDLLEQQPDLRPRLLRVLLTDDFLRLLAHSVQSLADSQKEMRQEVKELSEKLN